MNSVLSVMNAVKSFGSTKALDDASFELRQGEWLALLGPNGAGKTTIVRSIAGRVRLDSGKIMLLGAQLNGARDLVRRKLGIVPQEIALYPRLTAQENLRCFGELVGLNGAALDERVKWALDFTALSDRANDPIQTFSGGMKRRLNLVCAVLDRPPVLLLDEPTVGVDPQSRQRIWEMLETLRRDGASLLLTTHQLDEAQQICDRIVVIDRGKVVADGTLDELVRKTIGSRRQVSITLSNGETMRSAVSDIGEELSKMLSEAGSSGRTVTDVHIESPTLQAVFIHLTGRELRE
ncbi:MAG TPA: ABC transporter ATP-binding protein [Terriglobia bacterium]|nr:ABC transporter ATP-binding protein [Terriglobia bacterium]